MPTVSVLVLSVLAVWRVSHLIVAEDGPGGVIARVRAWADTSWMGAWMDCFGCVSLLVSAVGALMLSSSWPDRAVLWLGIAGGALMAQRLTEAAVAGMVARRAPRPADRPLSAGGAFAEPSAGLSAFTPVERGWEGGAVSAPVVTSQGVQRTVEALSQPTLHARPATADGRRRPGERREQAATLGLLMTDREVPRPASVRPVADRVASADDLFEGRRPAEPPSTDGTIWR